MSSVLLSQDLASSLPGVNLKWAYTAVGTVKEISLVYFKNASNSDINSADIASGLVRYNLATGFVSGQAYTYQLQVVNVSGNIVYSNALVLTAVMPHLASLPLWALIPHSGFSWGLLLISSPLAQAIR